MIQLPRYESYKDSGVQWLGEIPSHWAVLRLDKGCEIVRGNTGFSKADLLEEGQYVALQYGRTYKVDEINDSFSSYVNEEFYKSGQIAGYGDIVLISTSETIEDLGHSCFYARQDIGLIGGEQFLLKVNQEKASGKYFYYLTKAFSRYLRKYATGTKVYRFNSDNLKRIYIPQVPLDEQRIIADFLDKRLAQVDALIAKQETLLEKLAEQRVALISHAVTKGLNPDEELKDSGIEWFGSVPKHWIISKLSYSLSAIGDVDHYMPESIDDSGVPYVMTGDLKELVSDIDFEQCKQVSHDDYLKLSKKIKTSKGDIIFARYATIGTLSYVDIDKEFLVSYSCVTIKSNLEKLLGTYLYYYFKADAFFKEVQKQINTNTQGNVGIDNLRRIKVLLPPLSEQEDIVDFLNIETKKIDDMKEVVEKTIERFKEYRSTLITQVVTGKIDVRKLQIK